MKKFYLIFVPLFMALSVCIGFASCSSDDDGDDSGIGSGLDTEELLGTWEFSTGVETVMGETITIDRSMLAQMEKQLEQVAGTNIEFWDVTLRISENKINGAPYKLKGNRIVMEGMDLEGLSFEVTVKSVTKTTLVLHEVMKMDDLSIVADMTYIKE